MERDVELSGGTGFEHDQRLRIPMMAGLGNASDVPRTGQTCQTRKILKDVKSLRNSFLARMIWTSVSSPSYGRRMHLPWCRELVALVRNSFEDMYMTLEFCVTRQHYSRHY